MCNDEYTTPTFVTVAEIEHKLGILVDLNSSEIAAMHMIVGGCKVNCRCPNLGDDGCNAFNRLVSLVSTDPTKRIVARADIQQRQLGSSN